MDTKSAIGQLLKIIGKSGFSGMLFSNKDTPPNWVNQLLTQTKLDKKLASLLLKEFRRQKLVVEQNLGDQIKVQLTPAGMVRLQKLFINEIEIDLPTKWDKKWRVISFDVPINFSAKRIAFVDKLRSLGFVMIQKSLWVHPAPCLNQIEDIAQHYNLHRYCSFMEISKLDSPTQAKLLKKFNLS